MLFQLSILILVMWLLLQMVRYLPTDVNLSTTQRIIRRYEESGLYTLKINISNFNCLGILLCVDSKRFLLAFSSRLQHLVLLLRFNAHIWSVKACALAQFPRTRTHGTGFGKEKKYLFRIINSQKISSINFLGCEAPENFPKSQIIWIQVYY